MRLEDELKTKRFQDEVHKAQLNILFTASRIHNRVADSLKPFDLTPEQFNVLRILRGCREPFMLIKDITSRMIERNSNTTRIIDRLEGKGLVTRVIPRYDRRERQISLTEAGREMLAVIDKNWQANNPHTAPWSQEEARLVSDLLDKMRE